MVTKVLNKNLGFALVLAFLAGCSNTKTTDDQAAADAEAARAAAAAAEAQAAEEAAMLEAKRKAAEEAAAMLQTVFYFDFDQSLLTPEARAGLTAQAERLKASPRSIRLEGHADERGSREYNMALGERRANAVRDFLVLQGVDGSLIETISYGEERPAAMGSNDMAYSKNRRVELK